MKICYEEVLHRTNNHSNVYNFLKGVPLWVTKGIVN